MNVQVRDIVLGMVETESQPDCCDLCGELLSDNNIYSPFATVCRECADEAE